MTCDLTPQDDRYFLSGSLDGKLRLWNIPDKKVALWNELDGQAKLITAANFCQVGPMIIMIDDSPEPQSWPGRSAVPSVCVRGYQVQAATSLPRLYDCFHWASSPEDGNLRPITWGMCLDVDVEWVLRTEV